MGAQCDPARKILKGWSRAKKILLIEETNPTWEDLSKVFGSPAQLGLLPPQGFGSHVRTADPSLRSG